jgi:hypothetical protein
MSAEIVNISPNILTLKVSGKLTQSEFAAAQYQAADILRKGGKKHMLVIAHDFHGWGKGDWGDLSGQAALDPFIDRIAIVCERKWKDEVLLFAGKGIRRVAIEYFPPADLANAQAWLANG